jgi:hypothetical protein
MSESNGIEHARERRVAVRWSSSQQASCHFATLEKITCRWARVANVSLDGIGLILPCPLEAGQDVVIELPCKDPTNAKTVSAHVVHVQELDPGSWSLGCAFDKPLTTDDLNALV